MFIQRSQLASKIKMATGDFKRLFKELKDIISVPKFLLMFLESFMTWAIKPKGTLQ